MKAMEGGNMKPKVPFYLIGQNSFFFLKLMFLRKKGLETKKWLTLIR